MRDRQPSLPFSLEGRRRRRGRAEVSVQVCWEVEGIPMEWLWFFPCELGGRSSAEGQGAWTTHSTVVQATQDFHMVLRA